MTVIGIAGCGALGRAIAARCADTRLYGTRNPLSWSSVPPPHVVIDCGLGGAELKVAPCTVPMPITRGDMTVIGIAGLGRLGRAIATHYADTRLYDTRNPLSWSSVPPPDVVIDCGAPEATHRVLDLCAALGVPLVECVSNLWPGHLDRLTELSRFVPVVRATNLALGNYLQARVLDHLGQLLRKLSGCVDLPEAAVFERHPATKAHRPSATATALADRWQEWSGSRPADVASLRAGLPVSDHEILLAWAAETLLVRHEVRSLDAAAAGAVVVARWVVGRPPGSYDGHAAYDSMIGL